MNLTNNPSYQSFTFGVYLSPVSCMNTTNKLVNNNFSGKLFRIL